MKKIFTLLFFTAFISSAFAQGNRRDWQNRNNAYYNRGNEQGRHDWDRNNAYDNRGHDQYRHYDNDRDRRGLHVNFIVYGNNQYRLDQRDEVIAQISSDYDYQIQQVINNCELSPREKRYEIADLQSQKEQAINGVYAQCRNEVGFQLQFNPFRNHRDNDDH